MRPRLLHATLGVLEPGRGKFRERDQVIATEALSDAGELINGALGTVHVPSRDPRLGAQRQKAGERRDVVAGRLEPARDEPTRQFVVASRERQTDASGGGQRMVLVACEQRLGIAQAPLAHPQIRQSCEREDA